MGNLALRALVVLVTAWVVVSAGEARAQSSDPNCSSGMPSGFKFLPEYSSPSIPEGNPTSFTCNLANPGRAGIAVTVEYACAAETEAAWQSKVGNRTKNVVSRSATEVLVREVRSVRSYAGEFTASEKLFLRVDARTIATVVVPSNIENGKLDFGAEDAAGYARGRATANAPFSSNWKCPEGVDMPPVPTTSQPAPSGGPGPAPGPAPAPTDKRPKKSSDKDKDAEADDKPILGLSWPVLISIVVGVVLLGAGFTWIVRRPRRVRVR